MKRRTFILTGIAGTVAIALPVIKYKMDHIAIDDPLMRPTVLSNFCDEKQVREIGASYLAQAPEESQELKLRHLLLIDENGKQNEQEEKTISEILDKKVNREFSEGKIVVESGWVLSQTEARQCALFSLTT